MPSSKYLILTVSLFSLLAGGREVAAAAGGGEWNSIGVT